MYSQLSAFKDCNHFHITKVKYLNSDFINIRVVLSKYSYQFELFKQAVREVTSTYTRASSPHPDVPLI